MIPAATKRIGNQLHFNRQALVGLADHSAVLGQAIGEAMAARCRLILGAGPIVIRDASLLPVLDSVALDGDGVDCQDQPYGSRGTAFLIYDHTNVVFRLNSNVSLRGLSFFWPEQRETGLPPTAYPPLFGCASPTQGFSSCTFERLRITNAYDIWVADQAGQNVGDIQVRGVRAGALNDVFRIAGNLEVISVSDCLFSYESFDDVVNQYGVASPTYGLRDYVTEYGSLFHVLNTPAGGAAFLKMSNSYVFGVGRPLYVEGTGTLWFLLDGVDFDGCQQVLRVDPNGSLVTCAHRSGLVFPYRPGHESDTSPPVWDIDYPANLSLRLGRDVVIQGGNAAALVSIRGATNAQVDVGIVADNFMAPVAVLVSDDSGGVYRIENMRLIPAQANNYIGVEFANSHSQLGLVGGSYFHAPNTSFRADGGGPYVVAGNTSLYSSGPDVALGGDASLVPEAWNAWSRP